MDYEATFKNFFLHNYIIFATLAIIKITFTSFILLVGALIIGHKTKIKNYFKVTTLAYFIDFIRYFILEVWAFLNWDIYTEESLHAYNKITCGFLGNSDTIWGQFLKNFNAYDLLLIAALIVFLKIFSQINWKQSSRIIFSSYVPAVIVYALFMSLFIM
jgi:hypothetical protein